MPLPVEPAVLAAFVAASFALLVIPGPTVIMVITRALAHGRRTTRAGSGLLISAGLATLLVRRAT